MDINKFKELCLASGMSEQVWLSIENPGNYINRMTGNHLPVFIATGIPLDRTMPDKAGLSLLHPGALVRLRSLLQFNAPSYFVTTRGEDWWTGPKSWLADTVPLMVEAMRYEGAIGNPDWRVWKPTVRGRGRPAGPVKESNAVQWNAWLEHCAMRRDHIKQLEAEVELAKLECKRRVNLIQEYKDSGTNTWEKFKTSQS